MDMKMSHLEERGWREDQREGEAAVVSQICIPSLHLCVPPPITIPVGVALTVCYSLSASVLCYNFCSLSASPLPLFLTPHSLLHGPWLQTLKYSLFEMLCENRSLIKSHIMALRGGRSEDIRWSSSHDSLRSAEWQGWGWGRGRVLGAGIWQEWVCRELPWGQLHGFLGIRLAEHRHVF